MIRVFADGHDATIRDKWKRNDGSDSDKEAIHNGFPNFELAARKAYGIPDGSTSRILGCWCRSLLAAACTVDSINNRMEEPLERQPQGSESNRAHQQNSAQVTLVGGEEYHIDDSAVSM
jgi:hypothetical protein